MATVVYNGYFYSNLSAAGTGTGRGLTNIPEPAQGAEDVHAANLVKGNENGVANVHEDPIVRSCYRCHLNQE